MTTTTNEVVVHEAEWDGPQVQADEVVWNAPRPLFGRTWEGKFRAGIFYSITGPDDQSFADENVKLDARRVRFVTNAEVERELMAKLAEYGYDTPEDAGLTMAELAADYGFPYVV
jgi:hypothetical protein